MRAFLGQNGERVLVWAMVALAALAVLVIKVLPSGHHPPPAPTAAEVGAASRWLADLTPLPAATPDPSDTACEIPVALCFTSRDGPRTLAGSLHRAFMTGAGAPGRTDCYAAVVESCQFSGRYRGVSIGVVVRSLSGYRRAASVALVDFLNADRPSPGPTQPLPALGSFAAVLPPASLRLPCTRRLGQGCATYSGHFALPGGSTGLSARWDATLRAQGWLVIEHPTPAVPGGRRYILSATRSLAPRGERFVLMTAVITDGGHGRASEMLEIAAI